MKRTLCVLRARPLPLWAAIVLAVLALHLIILPLLYAGLDRIIVRTHSELFVAVADGYTLARVRSFQSNKTEPTAEQLNAFVDETESSGVVVYSAIRWDGLVVRRSVDPSYAIPADIEHDSFGSGDDHTYHTVARLAAGGRTGTLQLGFDETPITANIAAARRLVIGALTLYVIAVVGVALLFARRLSAPLETLQVTSTRIAAGDRHREFAVSSGIRELDRMSESLERMRAELVSASEQLQRRQRLETVGTLAGGVAHEFNNILVPLTLFTESALKALPPEHIARPWLARSIAAAQRAREVVSKLLLFSGRGAPAPLAPMDLAPAIEEAVRLFSSLRPSNVELDVQLDAPTDRVLASSSVIIHILMNLCTNAFYAIPASGGRITVALRNVVEAGHRAVELSVEDTGVGMDAATLQRIFEPYFTTREVGKGTGLGLAVAHGLVQSLRGTIDVQSTPGRGSRFRILFPSVGGTE